MTINFSHHLIKENSDSFFELIEQSILALKANKTVKFKTSKGTFGVHYNKKENYYSITMDGYGIETVDTTANAYESLVNLYKSK